jgi:hypothetical protein
MALITKQNSVTVGKDLIAKMFPALKPKLH